MAAKTSEAKRGQARVLLAEALWEGGPNARVDVLADVLAVLRDVNNPGPGEYADAQVLAEVVAELTPVGQPGPLSHD